MKNQTGLKSYGGQPVAGTAQDAKQNPGMEGRTPGANGPGMDPYPAQYRRLIGSCTGIPGAPDAGFGNGEPRVRPSMPVGNAGDGTGVGDTTGGGANPYAGQPKRWGIGKKQPQDFEKPGTP